MLYFFFTVFYLVECSLTKWCDIINFTNSSGDLSSPKPNNTLLYPDDTQCIWRITISDANQHIKLSFKTFHLEDCNKCTCDFVEIFDVVGPKQNSLGRFCGSSLPGPFYSSKQSLLVVFQSDHGNGFPGFTASYSTVLPGAVCRNATRLITAVGTIHSPEFLNRDYYPTNVDCIWQITTPYNTRMRFKIMHMSIQSCGKSGTPEFCSCDYLEIRDGRSSSDRLLATLCGTRTELPETIYSSGRNLWVRFKSDGEVVSSGFVASFSSKKIKKGSCPADWKYPFKCPQEINTNKTAACCYDNGPNCCEPGGRRCSDDGSSQRDYCPRPTDSKKLKYCCTKQGQPSCCESSGVCTKARFILLCGVIVHVLCVFYKWYHGMSII